MKNKMKIIEFSSGVVIVFDDLIILYDDIEVSYFGYGNVRVEDWEGNLLESWSGD